MKKGPQKILRAISDAKFCVWREIDLLFAFRYPSFHLVTVL